jgi:hypothetical protein
MTPALGGGIRIAVHREIAPVVSLLLHETVRLGYPLRQQTCGGYSYRAMKTRRGTATKTPSNHSWGLAVDLNWDANGFGPTAPHDIPEWTVELWEQRGFNWGGRWRIRDWMHFEFAGTVDDARRMRGEHGDVRARPVSPEEALMVGFVAAVVPMGATQHTAGGFKGKWPFVAVQVKEDGTTEFVGYCGCTIAGGTEGFGLSVRNLGRLNAPIVSLCSPADGKVIGLAPDDLGVFTFDVQCRQNP